MTNLIDHHVGQLRNQLNQIPNSPDKTVALTRLAEFEMWAARCDTTNLVPQPEENLVDLTPIIVTPWEFIKAREGEDFWILENGPNKDGFYVLSIGKADNISAVYWCNGVTESPTIRQAFQQMVHW